MINAETAFTITAAGLALALIMIAAFLESAAAHAREQASRPNPPDEGAADDGSTIAGTFAMIEHHNDPSSSGHAGSGHSSHIDCSYSDHGGGHCL